MLQTGLKGTKGCTSPSQLAQGWHLVVAAEDARQLQCFSCSQPLPACPADKAVKEDGDSDKRGWFANLLSGPGSTVALAFLCNKALLPVRVPITVGLTPAVAR